MNKGIRAAFALSMCLGATTVQIEAVADDAAASASSDIQPQPRKRRIASVKGDSKGNEGSTQADAASADSSGTAGRKRRIASVKKQQDGAPAEKKSEQTTVKTAPSDEAKAKATAAKGEDKGAAAAQQQAASGQPGAGGDSGESAPQTPSARPWAEGVSQENQQKALKLFREGNGLLKDSLFGQAAGKYREALEFWDHPAIHYNLVLALLNMDRPVEVLEHLEKAMAYGPEPIDPEKFEQAKNYKRLTESQLTHLVVRCELEGAVISMDGQELFTAPGQYEGFVRPGPHSIVAKKEGYMNNEISPALIAGGKAEYDMVLILAADAVEYRRRWAVWKPWTVFGAGIVVAGVGAALHLSGRSAISDYDDQVNEAGTNGVDIDKLESQKNSGLRNQKIGVAMYGIGGAAIAAGATLLVLNRARPYNPTTGELMDVSKDKTKDSSKSEETGSETPVQTEESSTPEVSVLPILSPESAGLMATFRF